MAVPNGAPKPKAKPEYDPAFTDRVISATGPNTHARLAEMMPSLVRHLYDFVREVRFTVAEWSAAVNFVSPFYSTPLPIPGSLLPSVAGRRNEKWIKESM